MAGIDLTQSVVRQIPVPPKGAWQQPVELHGAVYPAADAVQALEKLLYRKEPTLAGLWGGVRDIPGAEQHYQSGADIRDEIDRIVAQLYGLTDAEAEMVKNSFK